MVDDGIPETGETDLERELRARRPQHVIEFVRRLSGQITPLRREQRVGFPKVALVAALTAVLVASLGAAGALGAARGPVHTFSLSVVHLVSPPRTSAAPATTTTTTTSGQTSNANATPTHWPFQAQYGGLIPTCWHGSIIWVTPRQWVWYLFHGARPVRSCGGVPFNP